MAGPNQPFDDEPLDEALDDELDTHYEALRAFVLDYIEENDVPDEAISALLIDLSFELRKVAYVLETEKPSVAGLKLALDRHGADVESVVRAHKKEAEIFLEGMRQALAEAEQALDDDDEAPKGADGSPPGRPKQGH
jgi:hypothetical protein